LPVIGTVLGDPVNVFEAIPDVLYWTTDLLGEEGKDARESGHPADALSDWDTSDKALMKARGAVNRVLEKKFFSSCGEVTSCRPPHQSALVKSLLAAGSLH
jgi:hypothetical protein